MTCLLIAVLLAVPGAPRTVSWDRMADTDSYRVYFDDSRMRWLDCYSIPVDQCPDTQARCDVQ